MTVRAKFTVTSITSYPHVDSKTVKLMPQYDMTIPEDQRYAKATPSGEIMMYVDNPAALAELNLGQAFYVDFTPVPPLPKVA